MSLDRQWFVYTLSDPRTNDIRYVGWTVDIKRRLYLHIWHSTRKYETNRHKARWIAALLNAGVDPKISVIESGLGDGWKEAEPRWIKHFRAAGSRLTNLTDGGQGNPGAVVKESTRRLISANGKGKGFWKKGLAFAAVANRGRKLSPEHVAKVVQKNTGKRRSVEFCAAISERNRGRTASPETRALQSSIRRGRTTSEEVKRVMSEAQKLRWQHARDSLQPGATTPWAGMRRTPEQTARIKSGRFPHIYNPDGTKKAVA